LYHFGVPSIDSIFRTDDVGDAKPVGDADDGAQVARILDAIEGDGEGAQLRGNPIGDREEGENLLGVLLEAEATEFIVSN
jgi:hypothetical protein